MAAINKNQAAFNQKRQQYQSQERPYIRSEFLAANPPPITSINQKKHLSKVEARRREGLTDALHDTKDEVRQPSLSFISNPKTFSKTQLQDNRRTQMLHDLKKNEEFFATHMDG